MITSNNFIIRSKKNLIFRKENQFKDDKEWITFDPIELEFYSMNTIAAEIFYLFSLELSKEEAYLKFSKKYDLSFKEFEDMINDFQNQIYLFRYVKHIAIIKGW